MERESREGQQIQDEAVASGSGQFCVSDVHVGIIDLLEFGGAQDSPFVLGNVWNGGKQMRP